MRFIKNNWLFLAILIIAVMAAVLVFYPKSSKRVLAQDNFVLYYGNTCPHCIALEKYMVDNNIEARLPEKLVKKEVFNDRDNSQELLDRAGSCGISDLSQVGVPFLWHKGKCYIGEPDTKKYFEDLISGK